MIIDFEAAADSWYATPTPDFDWDTIDFLDLSLPGLQTTLSGRGELVAITVDTQHPDRRLVHQLLGRDLDEPGDQGDTRSVDATALVDRIGILWMLTVEERDVRSVVGHVPLYAAPDWVDQVTGWLLTSDPTDLETGRLAAIFAATDMSRDEALELARACLAD